jgi:hypothetical protein
VVIGILAPSASLSSSPSPCPAAIAAACIVVDSAISFAGREGSLSPAFRQICETPTQVMSVAAAAATLQASRVSSGAEACSRTGGAACWGCRPTGWQQEQGRRRGGAHRLMAAHTQGRSASRRPLVARAAAEPAEAPPQAAAGALVPDRQGYRSFLLVSPWAVSGRGGSACIRTSAEVQSLLAVEPLTMRSAV